MKDDINLTSCLTEEIVMQTSSVCKGRFMSDGFPAKVTRWGSQAGRTEKAVGVVCYTPSVGRGQMNLSVKRRVYSRVEESYLAPYQQRRLAGPTSHCEKNEKSGSISLLLSWQ